MQKLSIGLIFILLITIFPVLAQEPPRPTIRPDNADVISKLRQLGVYEGTMGDLAFSPDGKLLASAGSSDEGNTQLWSMETGKQLSPLPTPISTVVLFSPDSSILAISDHFKTHLWDIQANSEIALLDGGMDIAFSQDGSTLATITPDALIIWDMATNQEKVRIEVPPALMSAAFSPDGSYIVTAADDGTVIVWDTAAGSEVKRLEGASDGIPDLAFSPDGALLAAASWDQTVLLWDFATGELISTLSEGEDWLRSVTFSPDGTLLLADDDGSQIYLWDVSTGELLNTFFGTAPTFSPDGSLLAIAGVGSRDLIELWGIDFGVPLFSTH